MDTAKLFSGFTEEQYNNTFAALEEMRKQCPQYRDDQLLMYLLIKAQQNKRLPEGITSVETEDCGCGEVLIVEFKNGHVLGIDNLSLGDHESQVAVYTAKAFENAKGPSATILFDAEKGIDAWVAPQKENQS